MNEWTGLSDAEVETIYAAYDTVAGWEAKSIEGKRGIVEPIYQAVIRARVQTAQMNALRDQVDPRSDEDIEEDLLDDVLRATEEARVDNLGAALETVRRYLAGEITERQACDWFRVDRLTFRNSLAALWAAASPDLATLREALEILDVIDGIVDDTHPRRRRLPAVRRAR